MRKSRIPENIVRLVEEWLLNRKAFVEIGLETSESFKIRTGTVQGSVLSPVLIAVFVKDVMEMEPITIFADDNYQVQGAQNEIQLKERLQRNPTFYTNS